MKLGCNYWASNAGTEMWRRFDTAIIRRDLKTLHENGVEYLRVFPNWRDFQPVEPLYGGKMNFREYQLSGDRKPENIYYLDEEMLEKFSVFCDICAEYDMKLIVGLITGWMSGRMFIPTALNGKDPLVDRECLYFEQLFVTGFVKRFRDKEAIYAWDHGNECHCMGNAPDFVAAESWTQMISNAIYAQDRSRPVISSIHNMSLNGVWRIAAQGAHTDMLVSHPYPYWGIHTKNDRVNYIRTMLYSAAQSRLYADIGGKPCLVEEIGTMGPSVCAEELAADYLRGNFFSIYANGGEGLLWWCASDQDHLLTPPYTWTMVENELGMMTGDGRPKPVLTKMKALSELVKSFDFTLPKAEVDAVCLLTRDQDSWGVAYMTYVVAKQAGLNIGFADAAEPLPDAKVYLLPCVGGAESMPKQRYWELKEKVKNGAVLYISQDDGILSDFEAVTGNRILDSEYSAFADTMTLNGREIRIKGKRRLYLENVTAQQLKTPWITQNAYGKGTVYFVNFPLEASLLEGKRSFDNPACEVYKEVFRDVLAVHPVKIANENVALTIHSDGSRLFAVAVNHSEEIQSTQFETNLTLKKIHYGDPAHCAPLDAVIVEFSTWKEV